MIVVGALVLVLLQPWRTAPNASRPLLVPNPKAMDIAGPPVVLDTGVTIGVTSQTDPAALRLLRSALRSHSISVTEQRGRARASGTTILLGPISSLRHELPADADLSRSEGYLLSIAEDLIVIGGVDGAGQFYGVRTLSQLLTPDNGRLTVPQLMITDYPDLPVRGVVEGFYGSPWSQAERLDQLDYYGSVKLNTYIYAPKDDPYHRSRWREPYPHARLAELRQLVQRAADNHVHFTFALSPGLSMCFSSGTDRSTLFAKLQTMYDLGVRSFAIALDDIDYTRWHCDADASRYGTPGSGSGGRAQAELLNVIQRRFIDTHPGSRPLLTVPTEYGSVSSSAYKRSLSSRLDPRIVIMWTGVGVIPKSITRAAAEQASVVWGRKVLLWDNYPVNDFPNSAGRLLLAPYARRQAGLSASLVGIVANPMNQAAASKVALAGVADYAWTDTGYHPQRTWRWAFQQLAGGDRDTTEALLVLGDLCHLAPTSGGTWQPQAPRLKALTARVSADLDHADLSALRGYARLMEAGPALMEAHVSDQQFLSDTSDWRKAMGTWGRALDTVLDAVEARRSGQRERAQHLADQAGRLMSEARAAKVTTSKNAWSQHGPVPVKLGDGVLDTFISTTRATLARG
nr:beta-N-acetylglucosaminidase domain-containing protein [Microlunatus panaciterrae]